MRGLGRGLLGAAALIALLTALARVAGFARGLVFTGSVGNTSAVGEAYNAANTVPNVLFEVVAGGALAGAVVPLLAGPLARAQRAHVDRVVGALLGWALLLLVPSAVAVALLAGPLASLLRPGADAADQRALVAVMLVVFAPQVVLYGLGVVLTGTLQAQRRFAWPAAAPLASSLVVVGAYLAYAAVAGGRDDGEVPGAAVAVLAGGTTLGVVVLTLPLLGPVLASGVRPRPTLRFPPGVLRRARGLAAAGLLALLAQQVAVLTALVLGGRLGDPVPGSFSVFVQVVQPVALLPYAVLAVPLATSAFPRLAEHASRGDAAGYARTAALSTRAVVLVALLGAAVLAAAAPAVEVFYAGLDTGLDPGTATAGEPGAATAYGAVGPAVTAVAPSLLGLALVAHVTRALYALERGRAAAAATVGGWLAAALAQVLLAALLPGEARVVAMAGGTSAGMLVAAVLLLRALRRVAGAGALAGVARTAAAAAGAGLVGAVAGRLVVAGLLGAEPSGTVAVVTAAVAGAVTSALVVGVVVLLADRSAAAAVLGRLRGGRRTGAPAAGGAAPGGAAPGGAAPGEAVDGEAVDGRGRDRAAGADDEGRRT